MKRQFSLKRSQSGFSLLELLISVGIFVLISGAAFGLLNSAQKRYQTEGQMLSSFQEGRLALDQIVRDVNDAGYPPKNQYSAAVPVTSYAVTPVAWHPGYIASNPCTIGGSCTNPGDFDLILEGYDSTTGTMQWVRYQLINKTLYRGTLAKGLAVSPTSQMTVGNGVMFPYATNVMNSASAAEKAAINAAYPGTFPGGADVPVFSYTCDTGTVPTLCTAAGAFNSPTNVRDVEVTLIIQTQQPDMENRRLRVVSLNGRGHRINPNQ
jgi:prepilin-type N-terminal cleavage/methylation domain-containing protein